MVGVGLTELDYAVTIVAVRYQRVTVAIFKAGHVSTRGTQAACTSVVSVVWFAVEGVRCGAVDSASSVLCLGAATSQLSRVMAPGCQDLGVVGMLSPRSNLLMMAHHP